MASRQRQTILFLTNSELGQANVFFAVLYELLRRSNLDLHFGTFSVLHDKVTELFEQAKRDLSYERSSPSNITFHDLGGKSMTQILENELRVQGKPATHKSGIRGAFDAYRLLQSLAAPWHGPEYVAMTQNCERLIQSVNPDVVVIDPLLCQGIDACVQLGRQYVILSPNTFKDLTKDYQTKYHVFCEIPAPASGFSYPVPKLLIPINIFLRLSLIIILICSAKIRGVLKARKAAGYKHLHPAFKIYNPDAQYLSPSIPSTDFPCKIPPNMTGCGPILLASLPVAEVDPDLAMWLQARSGGTVLVNLGTLNVSDAAYALEMAKGLKRLLDAQPEIQVLWKIKTSTALSSEIAILLSDALAKDRIRIFSWLKADPLSILSTGNVILSVHHGGSNTWHEAVSFGIPQVVLPLWFDTYDFAARTEYLRLGIWGNKKHAPDVEERELGSAMILAVGEAGRLMRDNARLLGEEVKMTRGRSLAADKILEWCGGWGGGRDSKLWDVTPLEIVSVKGEKF